MNLDDISKLKEQLEKEGPLSVLGINQEQAEQQIKEAFEKFTSQFNLESLQNLEILSADEQKQLEKTIEDITKTLEDAVKGLLNQIQGLGQDNPQPRPETRPEEPTAKADASEKPTPEEPTAKVDTAEKPAPDKPAAEEPKAEATTAEAPTVNAATTGAPTPEPSGEKPKVESINDVSEDFDGPKAKLDAVKNNIQEAGITDEGIINNCADAYADYYKLKNQAENSPSPSPESKTELEELEKNTTNLMQETQSIKMDGQLEQLEKLREIVEAFNDSKLLEKFDKGMEEFKGFMEKFEKFSAGMDVFQQAGNGDNKFNNLTQETNQGIDKAQQAKQAQAERPQETPQAENTATSAPTPSM